MLNKPNGKAQANASHKPRQSRCPRGESSTSASSTSASNAEKYFERNARPRKIPASACQRGSLEGLANHHARPDKKQKKTSGVSVVMNTFDTLTGTRRKASAPSVAFSGS